MTAPVDFTACPRVPGRAYNGANGKKICVAFEGARWMLKFPPPAGERPTALSYTNSCLSEHLASSAFRLLGLDAQETRLGTFRNGRRLATARRRATNLLDQFKAAGLPVPPDIFDRLAADARARLEDDLLYIEEARRAAGTGPGSAH